MRLYSVWVGYFAKLQERRIVFGGGGGVKAVQSKYQD